MKKVAGLLVLMVGCIEPYMPSEIKPAGAILVIDGHIDTNRKSIIKLSRSQNLFESAASEKVTGALVWLENENGVKYALTEEGNGNYSLAPQSFASVKYSLNVRTKDAKEYVSDFVEIKNSPAIDSVSWEVTADLGINIYVTTHSAEANKGYYRWKFEETWRYTSAYTSTYIYDFTTKRIELRQDDIYTCWDSNSSADILISTSSRLSENVISKFPITYVEQRDERLRYTYSILVKQYSITEDAYSYWKQLKKTTEDLGTIFSPMPSQVTGNYHSLSNSEEPVLGYFSMGASVEKRIFINSLELPRPNTYKTGDEDCEQYQLLNADIANFNFRGPFLLTSGIPNPNGPGIIGYYYAITRCADCTTTGGTNVKPDFWP